MLLPQVFRRAMSGGTSSSGSGGRDELLYEEADARHYVTLTRTKDWRFLLLNSHSKLSSEVKARAEASKAGRATALARAHSQQSGRPALSWPCLVLLLLVAGAPDRLAATRQSTSVCAPAQARC